MSISKVARFVLRRLVISLAAEVKRTDAEIKATVAKRDARVAALDTEIIAMANREEKVIADIREKAEREVRMVLDAKRNKMATKREVQHACGGDCKRLHAKAEKAELMRSRVAAILK